MPLQKKSVLALLPNPTGQKSRIPCQKNFNAGLGVLDWACQHAALEADMPEDI